MQKTGHISIDAKNIMPVIKRWLYSDKDIFIRELVSNGMDAITKQKLKYPGAEEDYAVRVMLDKQNGNLVFMDNGIGMTDEEVEKYINQVAFSSAEEFLKNYTGGETAGIIGHFGLGFYSAFMAADLVKIDTLSQQEGAEPVLWQSEDGMAFDMQPGTRHTRGTTITLHIAEDEQEFLQADRVLDVLNKYCAFMPFPLYFEDLSKEEKADEQEKEEKDKAEQPAKETPVNQTQPLWYKNTKDVTEEEYKETYRRLFNTFDDPLFWIHLNVDYPFNLKGILYFPRIRRDFEGQEGQIKLFNRQVYVADNIKEIIPEFLMVLKGVIDCPDLPLNVSRSFLQNDGQVKKISAHIAKKVADKLLALFKTERETYQTYWNDIHPFIKYGCMRDSKFFDAMKGSLVYKTTDGVYMTLEEYRAKNEGKTGKKIYYTQDKQRQARSIALFAQKGIDVVLMDTLIDINFMSFMEYQSGLGDDAPRFMRVDADVEGLKEEGESTLDENAMQTLFREVLHQETLDVKVQTLKDAAVAALITEDEQMRRFKEMSAMYGRDMALPDKFTLVLNAKNDLVNSLAVMEEGEKRSLLAAQLYDLARLSAHPLEAEDLKNFIDRSNTLLNMLAK